MHLEIRGCMYLEIRACMHLETRGCMHLEIGGCKHLEIRGSTMYIFVAKAMPCRTSQIPYEQENQQFRFPTKSDTNWPVQSQNQARSLKFLIK